MKQTIKWLKQKKKNFDDARTLYTPAGRQTSATACCIWLDSYFGAHQKEPHNYILKRKTTALVSKRARVSSLEWFVGSGCFCRYRFSWRRSSALCGLLCLPLEIDSLRILHGTVRQNKTCRDSCWNCRQYAQWLRFAVSTVTRCNWTRRHFG